MKSSSVYKFVQVYLAPEDSKQYQAKTTTAGRTYFLCPVAISTPRLVIDDREYQVRDQHISIYSEHKDDAPGLEAYHLTRFYPSNLLSACHP